MLLLGAIELSAQPSFNVSSTIKPCDDYATLELDNPWDMSDSSDVNYFTRNDVESLSDLSFSGGIFNFRNTQTAAGHFYLLSPQIDSLQPVGGRWGQQFPINSSKYRYLTVRMNQPTPDLEIHGLRVLWHRGRSGASGSERTVTNLGAIPVGKGWRSYSVDLAAINSFDGVSVNPANWASAPIHGFALYPMVATNSGQIDYIRLEDPASCGSVNVPYTASAVGNRDLLSFYLDQDSDISNGFSKKLLSAATAANGSLLIDTVGLMPASYKLIAHWDSDYAGLERDNEWDMSEDTDVTTGGISNISFAGGVMSGTLADSSPNVFFDIPTSAPINAAKYTRLSLKISRSVNPNSDPLLLVWTKVGGGFDLAYLSQTSYDPDVDGVYHVNLGAIGGWSGLIDSLRIQLTTANNVGATFALDFMQLRKTGNLVNAQQGVNVVSAGNLVIADPPRLQILQPDVKGGELYRPNDMRPGDIGLAVNNDSAPDPAFPSESKTTYLPDVRSFEGVRGNLYKATNIAGNGDSNEYLNFPVLGVNRYTIDSDEFQHLCLKMALNRGYDLGLGSVTKHFYKRPNQDFESADAWATIYDHWSSGRWYEYCLDASTHPNEGGVATWGGTLEAFRIDPHEFSFDSCCDSNGNPIGNPIQVTSYIDYIRLAKKDRSYGKFALVYQTQDSDTANPSITWQYSTTANFSSPTNIAGGQLSCTGRVCIWDTSALVDGTYYVRATVSDGTNSNTSPATGALQIRNGQGAVETAPVLNIENPVNGRVLCSDMQVKGFALDSSKDEPVVALQVFIDGQFSQLVVPSDYSAASLAAYPSRLSESGFNFSVPVSGLSNGAHTVRIRAHTSNGGVTTSDISITKQTGCSDTVVSDSSPSGAPVPAELADNNPTPTPTVPTIGAPNLSRLSITRGVLGIQVSGIGQNRSSCSIQLSAGPSSGAQTSIKSYPISSSQIARGSVTWSGTRFLIDARRLKSATFGARYICSGREGARATRSIRFNGRGSIRTVAGLVSAARSRLKAK